MGGYPLVFFSDILPRAASENNDVHIPDSTMKNSPIDIPGPTLERMLLYKRLLSDAIARGISTLYSHELASLAHNSPAQVRRDLMAIGRPGNPRKGYDVKDLLQRLSDLLTSDVPRRIVLVGIGNLGRAILSYFVFRKSALQIVAAFDSDGMKTGRLASGCPCFPMSDLERIIQEENVSLGIITVPSDSAQNIADLMVAAGIRGILNFAPVLIKVPPSVSIDRIDIASAVEKLAFLAEHTPTDSSLE